MAGPTIHLFEDDAGLRDLLSELLHDELQARIVVATDIGELLRVSAAEPPDLIVADFWGESHLKLADEERAQVEALGQLAPTVLVSARQWAQDAGPNEFGLAALVSKPLDVDAFVTVLRDTLATHVR